METSKHRVDMNEGKRALIISYEVDLALLLKSYYLRKGYAVHCAYTLTKGLALAMQIQPHLIWLDRELFGDLEEFRDKLKRVAPRNNNNTQRRDFIDLNSREISRTHLLLSKA
jgi:hypothetical protein